MPLEIHPRVIFQGERVESEEPCDLRHDLSARWVPVTVADSSVSIWDPLPFVQRGSWQAEGVVSASPVSDCCALIKRDA